MEDVLAQCFFPMLLRGGAMATRLLIGGIPPSPGPKCYAHTGRSCSCPLALCVCVVSWCVSRRSKRCHGHNCLVSGNLHRAHFSTNRPCATIRTANGAIGGGNSLLRRKQGVCHERSKGADNGNMTPKLSIETRLSSAGTERTGNPCKNFMSSPVAPNWMDFHCSLE